MKLNPDCIRDVLLSVEEKTDFSNPWTFSIDSVDSKFLSVYSSEEILYHINQCSKSGLIDGCKIYDDGYSIFISDLSPSGHQFLADIRSDKIWSDVKSVCAKVGSNSLSCIMQIASGVITEIIKAQMRLNV